MLSFLKNLFSSETVDLPRLLKEGAIVIDVRSTGEFASGHLGNSRNIPLNIITSKVDQIRSLRKPIITVCRSGARSASAKSILENAGIEVYNGGAWTNLKHLI